MKQTNIFIILLFLGSSLFSQPNNQIWPQFRGVNSVGVAAEETRPPVNLNEKNLLWKTELTKGVSSPVVWNDKIFITGFIDSTKELQTLCLDRKWGRILWTRSIVPDTIEKYHNIASPAQGTVVTDGELVIAYFGSCGLVCYDMEGNQLWRYRVACNKSPFGHATSPVISGDKVIFFNDVDPSRFLVAIDKTTGFSLWRTNFPYPKVGNTYVFSAGGHAVPFIRGDKILLNRIGGVSCYSVANGEKLFDLPQLTAGNATPFIYKNQVIVTTWYNFSEENQRGNLPDFKELVKNDKNGNGTLDINEIPESMIMYQRPGMELEQANKTVKDLFWSFDTDRNKEITRQEWDTGLKLLNEVFYKPAGLMAICLENQGLLNDSAVVWRVSDNVPEVPSPLLYKNRIYMVKDGGILTCVDPENGKVVYVNKIGTQGAIMASPVAANGNIYFLSYNGKMKVIKAGDKFEIIGDYDFKEKVSATPAIIENTIYIRAGKNLYAFGN